MLQKPFGNRLRLSRLKFDFCELKNKWPYRKHALKIFLEFAFLNEQSYHTAYLFTIEAFFLFRTFCSLDTSSGDQIFIDYKVISKTFPLFFIIIWKYMSP